MMMALYSLILIGTALLISWGGERILNRVLKELGIPRIYAQLAIIAAVLAVFIIVSLSAGVLIGATVLLFATAWHRTTLPLSMRQAWVPLVLGIALGVLGIHTSAGQWPTMLPLAAGIALAVITSSACVFTARQASMDMIRFAGVTIAAAFPLALAPVLFPSAHTSIALDVALLSAGMLGGILIPYSRRFAAAFVRLPVALIMAACIMQAVRYGAWPLAVVSFGLFVMGMLSVRQHELHHD